MPVAAPIDLPTPSFTERNAPFRLVIAGGGTGGHLIPGCAIADGIRRRCPDAQVTFLIPGKPLERAILDAHGETYIECGGLPLSGGPIRKLKAVVALYRALAKSKAMLRDLSPDAVLAVGGYGSVCGGLAAKRLGIPLFLQEQNIVPGRVNRLLARYAETAFVQWKFATGLHRNCRQEVMGSPIRATLSGKDKTESRIALGLAPHRTTLLVMGGSQGAAAINRFILSDPSALGKLASELQVIHLTGDKGYDAIRSAWAKLPVRAAVLPFAKDMGSIYSASDFAVCRAGATSIAELLALGVPMALVPLPTSAHNHQALNAGFIERAAAGVLFEERKLADPGMLSRFLHGAVLNTRKREALASHARALGVGDAASRIAMAILTRFGVKPSALSAESLGRIASLRSVGGGRAAA